MTSSPFSFLNTFMIAKIGDTIVEITEVPDLKNYRGDSVLGLSWTDKNTGWIKIRKNLSLPEFWEYIEGKRSDSVCSVQKRAVMQLLGLTRESLGTIINTPERAKEFLLEHEFSHIRHHDSENKKLTMSGHLSYYRIAIEARATQEAWLKLNKKYGKV